MANLIDRIDDTRSHLARESVALVTRTRRAGDGLAKAVADEARDWQEYLAAGRDAVAVEVSRLSAPRGIERAALRLADEALARAHGTVHMRLGQIERELRAAAKPATKTKKARPSSKRTSAGSARSSRRLVTEPAVS